MNKRCVFILPYFGKFNNYFPLFLKSCGTNRDYDFLIITDNQQQYSYPTNVKVVFMTLAGFRKNAANKLGFEPCIPRSYKLCDFKPAYGLFFENLIEGYEYWGHCDCDLLFGNLAEFLTPIIDYGYDKIFATGHLTLYRNNYKNNRRFMNVHNGRLLYRTVFTTEAICGFDESQSDRNGDNVHEIFRNALVQMYSDDLSLNVFVGKDAITPCVYNPESCDYEVKEHQPTRVYWDNGDILAAIWESDEQAVVYKRFLYVHLQSRKMRFKPDAGGNDIVEIRPDRFKQVVRLPATKRDMHLLKLKMPSLFWFDVCMKKVKSKLQHKF